MIQAAGFDLDGTLVDTFPGIKSSLETAVAEVLGSGNGVVVERSHVGPPARQILKNILGAGVPDDRLVLIEKAFRSHYDNRGWKDCSVYPEVIETLQFLNNEGLRAFIVTNKPKGPTGLVLRHTGIEKLVSFSISIDSKEPRYGSKAGMLADAIGRCGFGPREVIFTGDTEEDFRAAESCNVHFVYAQYGYGKREFAPPASIVRMGDLVPLISTML